MQAIRQTGKGLRTMRSSLKGKSDHHCLVLSHHSQIPIIRAESVDDLTQSTCVTRRLVLRVIATGAGTKDSIVMEVLERF